MRHPFKIKICGVTTVQDAVDVARSGADAIGLNFYAAGKRFVSIETAGQIIEGLQPHRELNELTLVGVFVNHTVDSILDHVVQLKLNVVQLHGDETPQLLVDLLAQAASRGLEFDTLRAIRTAPGAEAPLDVDGVEDEAERWAQAGADGILVDAAAHGNFGGTGKQVDWNGVARVAVDMPVILAGGLKPENVGDAIRIAEPSAVDVASGVESAPGVKDRDKVFQFVKNAGMMQ